MSHVLLETDVMLSELTEMAMIRGKLLELTEMQPDTSQLDVILGKQIETIVIQAEILEAPLMWAEIMGLDVLWPEMTWLDVLPGVAQIEEKKVLIQQLVKNILTDLSFAFSATFELWHICNSKHVNTLLEKLLMEKTKNST